MTVESPAGSASDAILKIQDAFDQFETQSSVLKESYDELKKDLARTNRSLNQKNQELSTNIAELKAMSSRLQCILDSLADCVLVIDDNMCIEQCNPAAEALLGISRESILGRSYESITNGLGDVEAVRTVLNTGNSLVDCQRESDEGSCGGMVALASVVPIRSGNEETLGVVEVLRDMTQLRMLEKKAYQQERMAALGQMAASVAHEIRNPLGTIEGFARLLHRDLKDSESHSSLAGKIIEGVQNLNYVITNLLTYARPTSLQCNEFEVSVLLEEVREMLGDSAGRQTVSIHVGEADASRKLYADMRQIRQVVLNLALNAIQACGDGGNVHMSCEYRKKNIVLRINDDGCGMTEAEMESIFDPFYTSKHGGTGLGLSLCHKIVQSHGGEMRVFSEPEKGSTFEVIIPDGAGMGGR